MKLIIVGTTMFSAELAHILRVEGKEVCGYIVDAAYKTSDSFQDLPVFTFENIESYVDIKSVSFVLTLGYSQMNEHRLMKYDCCKSKGYKVFTYVSPLAQVYTKKIGEGSIILPGTYIGPFSEVGICSVIRPGTVLAHHDSVGDFNWIADGCTFGGGVTVGNHCFIGLGTTIRNEILIADYTFLGAQTYIGYDTDKLGAYMGVPAKKIEGKSSYDMISKV